MPHLLHSPGATGEAGGSGFLAGVGNIILVDIAEDIDFIHITEDIGIIGGGNGFSPVRFSIRSTAPKSRPLTRRFVERTASGSPYAPGGK